MICLIDISQFLRKSHLCSFVSEVVCKCVLFRHIHLQVLIGIYAYASASRHIYFLFICNIHTHTYARIHAPHKLGFCFGENETPHPLGFDCNILENPVMPSDRLWIGRWADWLSSRKKLLKMIRTPHTRRDSGPQFTLCCKESTARLTLSHNQRKKKRKNAKRSSFL